MSRQLVEARIRIAASPDDVYQALTDEAALRAWFAEDASVDIDQGRYKFSGRFTPGTPRAGATGVKLLRAEQGRELCYSWPVQSEDTVVAIALRAGEDSTDLTLEHRGLGKDTAWIFECFWSTALENLRSYAERGVAGLCFDYANVPYGDVELTIGIDAFPDTIFEALIDPNQLDRYMSADPARVDPQVGGVYDVGWGGEGPVKILDLEPGRLLSYSWRAQEADIGATVVTWQLEGSAGRTWLTLVHSGFAPDRSGLDYGVGWLDYLNRIKQLAEVGEAWRKPSIRLVEDRNIRNERLYLPAAGIHEIVAAASSPSTGQHGR